MAAPLTYVECASAGIALNGGERSGDRAVIASWADGTLGAVIDGLGHGPDAADAADAAALVLEAEPDAPLVELVRRCHAALRHTRGAALSVATIAPSGALAWLGIGNVAGTIARAPGHGGEGLATRGGTVGFQLPHVETRGAQLALGDVVVLASDGIKPSFRNEIVAGRTAEDLAAAIVARHALTSDDACVAVARFVGARR